VERECGGACGWKDESSRLTPKQHTMDAAMMPIKPSFLWSLPGGRNEKELEDE
jgi:hypothetical protein